jgi:endonuclease-3
VRSPHRARRLTPLDSLVLTVLSQNVNDRNSDRAFSQLRARFPTWQAVAEAPLEQVMEAVQPAGLMRQKAVRLKEVLRRVDEDRGEYDLAFLGRLPPEEAWAYLRGIPGIGPKTAAVVLLFEFGMPFFPVDTHVLRVSRRLGLVPPKATADRAHESFARMLQPEQMLPLHLDLIEHGRRICFARRPRCPICPLLEVCPQVGVAEVEGEQAGS